MKFDAKQLEGVRIKGGQLFVPPNLKVYSG